MSSNKYYITNHYSVPVTVELKWNDETINPQSPTWLTFENTEVTVEPNKTGTIDFTVNIPEGAEGLYYARILFQNKVDPSSFGVLSISYNFPLRIIVDGTQHYEYSVDKVELFNNNTFHCAILLINSGNVHLYAEGSIEVTSEDGTRYTSSCKIPQTGLILPQKSLACTADLGEVLPDGRYTITMSFVAGDDKSLTCTYNLQFSIQDGEVSLMEIETDNE
ncbi:MAG: hypothetical protein C4541_09700 [Candidatus Auribacter fodinae]|uniref:Uncharacterized protein n=1 Tax=Candidatus Auribacter fodinae TaxID=2093366 RepID=A0A3A4QUU3_9BACT|nr:MAG: hypothetical protein C4541_09700 [Candidatus Auribacter fodinae]